MKDLEGRMRHLKRTTSMKKKQFIDNLMWLNRLVKIGDTDKHLEEYDRISQRHYELSERILKLGDEIGGLEMGWSYYVSKILEKENIKTEDLVRTFKGNESMMLDELYQKGFVSESVVDNIKTKIWNEQKDRRKRIIENQ